MLMHAAVVWCDTADDAHCKTMQTKHRVQSVTVRRDTECDSEKGYRV